MKRIVFIETYDRFEQGDVWPDCPDHIARKLCEQEPYFAEYDLPDNYKELQKLAKEKGIPANLKGSELKEKLRDV